jgi:SlyX protein
MSDLAKLTARIDELEILLAHQDQIIEDLNAAMTRQWNEIEALSRQLAKLGDRIHVVEENASEPAPAEPPPPHY